MAELKLNQLSIRLGTNHIINQLDLAVESGEFLVLLGPSGCGKSTLLHAIAGLIDVAAGRVEIDGKDMTWTDPSAREIGMVFQSYALYPTMTVEKNMSFGLRIQGLPKAEIAARIERVAELLHLTPLLQRKPAALSGGQRQRVAIGRALVRQAKVFLFDEPLSNLDAKLRSSLRRELKLLHQRLRSTMIYVTHDQVEAMSLASRIVVMKEGKIQQIGAPEDVYDRPATLFVAGFLGSPAMNMVSGRLDRHGVFQSHCMRLDLRDYAFSEAWRAATMAMAMGDDHAAVLGVRPEQILLCDAQALDAMPARLSLIEPMGNHQVLWLHMGEQTLSCTVHQQAQFELGQVVHCRIDTQKISLFYPSDYAPNVAVSEQRI
ncbi:MAG: ABC transporter ATP-binding protein [Burkholderiales bacterium]|nr:ABC transporter ATP-binding protein [Burkholderiales bacterium]